MGLRPRTARRLILAGALLIIVVLGAAAFFTVPKLQNARQMRAFQEDGLAAHAEGNHHEAVQLLARYARGKGDEPVEPEVRLALARSRAKVESSDGSHLVGASNILREYLREYPDDYEAGVDLLELFVKTGSWAEARELAGRLRPRDPAETGDDRLVVLRHEARARERLDAADPVITSLEDRILESERIGFVDAWRALGRAELSGDAERAASVVDRYTAVGGEDDMGRRLLRAIYGSKGTTEEDLVASVSEAVGIDPETGSWAQPPAFDDPELVRVLLMTFGQFQREELVLSTLAQAATTIRDSEFIRSLVHRRYWSGRHDEILTDSPLAPGGTADPDTLGHTALIAMDRGDTQRLAEAEASLARIQHNFRAQGWLRMLASRKAFLDGEIVTARARALEAVERYVQEPAFHFYLGEIYNRQGRLSDAVDSWTLARDITLPPQGSSENQAALWTEPVIRAAEAYREAGRLSDAEEIAWQQFRLMGRREPERLALLLVQIRAEMAMKGLADADPGSPTDPTAVALVIAREYLEQESTEARTGFAVAAATLAAQLGLRDMARDDLSDLLGQQGDEVVMGEVMILDHRYGLGVVEAAGLPALPESVPSPGVARRLAEAYTLRSPEEAQARAEASLAFLDRGIQAAEASTRADWLRARAEFLDAIGDQRAAASWQAAMDAAPEDIGLLTAAADSAGLSSQPEAVERTIARIVELTATQGRTLPTRLRLARARSIFGQSPTRQRRDDAVSIVRSVVISEPRNVTARVMLANMLSFESPPVLQGTARFSPDYAGAIDQYLAAAGLVRGNQSVIYTFAAADLHILAGNEPQARQLLLGLIAGARDYPMRQERIAVQVGRLSDKATASRLLDDMHAGSQGPARAPVAIQLVQAAIAANRTARAIEVLREIAGMPDLNADQVEEVARRFRQVGLIEESNRILENAAQYGLSPVEAILVRARTLASFGEADQAQSILIDATGSHPDEPRVWSTLIGMLIAREQRDQALAYARDATERFPQDDNLRYLFRVASGDEVEAARALFADVAPDRVERIAFERIENYIQRAETLTPEQQIQELRGMLDGIESFLPAVNFILTNLGAAGDDPNYLADASRAALRRFPTDLDLLRFAADVHHSAGRDTQVRLIADSWRSASRGSPLEADLYWARASQRLGDHNGAVQRMRPYIAGAIGDPDSGLYPSVLRIYGGSALAIEPESVLRAELLPAAQSSSQFRSTVWLELGAFSVRDPQQAAGWLRVAGELGVEGSQTNLIQAWLALAQRFPQRGQEFAQSAVQAAGSLINGETEDVVLLTATAQAYEALASHQDHHRSVDPYSQAETLYVRAARLEPENLNHLFSAALAANLAGRNYEAEQYYRTLQAHPGPSGLFRAAIENNLANILSGPGASPARLAEAMTLVDRAIATESIAPFRSTRGWVLLGLERTDEALSEFEAATMTDPGSAEAWAGLAAARRVVNMDSTEVEAALTRARSLFGDRMPSRQLGERLRGVGLSWE